MWGQTPDFSELGTEENRESRLRPRGFSSLRVGVSRFSRRWALRWCVRDLPHPLADDDLKSVVVKAVTRLNGSEKVELPHEDHQTDNI
jgi:hypothetical protein